MDFVPNITQEELPAQEKPWDGRAPELPPNPDFEDGRGDWQAYKMLRAVRKKLGNGMPVALDELQPIWERLSVGAARVIKEDLLAIVAEREDLRRKLKPEQLEALRLVDERAASDYEERLDAGAKSGADRVAEHVSRRTSIPQLPPPANPERRDECEHNLLAFGMHYGTLFLQQPPSKKMEKFIRRLQRSIERTGLTHVRWPRGKGKTTWCKIAILWALLYGKRRYIVLISATQDEADAIIKELWEALETDEALLADFPEACIPIRALEGRMQRRASQTYQPTGKRTRIEYSKEQIDLPSIDGYPCSGARIIARGITSSIRGLVKKNVRPDFVLIDDIQTNETARSASTILEYEKKICGSIMGLGGHTKTISMAMTSTPICAGDLSDIFSGDKHPEWETFTSMLLDSFPSCYETDNDLWKEYFALRAQDIYLKNDFANCNAFYVEHRAEMDAGAEVIDENAYDRKEEHSAIQHAMNLLFTCGRDAFMAEYQMQPVRHTSVYELTSEMVMNACNGVENWHVPRQCITLVAAIDVMREDGLQWVIMGFGRDRVAAVVGYGRYPADGKPLWRKGAIEAEQATALHHALAHLCGELSDKRFPRVGGGTAMIDALGIDCGYLTQTVHTFRDQHKRLFQKFECMRGVGYDRYRPRYENGKPKSNILGVDDWAYTTSVDGRVTLMFHSDFWLEQAQRAWTNAPLQPGSISLYGDKPYIHHGFSQQICSERLVEKDESRNGVQTWKWSRNGRNHLGDCVKMCFVLAYWHKFYQIYDVQKRARELIRIDDSVRDNAGDVSSVKETLPDEKKPTVRKKFIKVKF